MKNVYRVSTKQHGDMKSGVVRSKNATILQARCASALSCSNMWKSIYPHRHVNVITLHVFVVATVKRLKLSSANQIFHHRSRLATDSTSWDQQACTPYTLWCQRYVTASKVYSIDCHILLPYFELMFIQLQLVQICVNWSSFEWIMKKMSLFMKHRVYF